MTDSKVSKGSKGSVPLVDLLGPTVIRTSKGGVGNEEICVAELARSKKTIALYFSAHWCPPCRRFTPKLSDAYASYRNSAGGADCEGNDDGFELVFVSSDRDAGAFEEYRSEMSFPALPYESREVKDRLSEKFGVKGIPHLVVVDAATGEESPVNEAIGDLRSFVVQHGAGAFPLSPSHVKKVKDDAARRQADALGKLAASSIKVTSPSECEDGEGGTTFELSELLDRHEYIGLIYGDGDDTDATYNEIEKARNDLGDERFLPLYVGWTKYGEQPNHAALWKRFFSIRDLTDEARSVLGDAAGGSMEQLAMLTAKSRGSGLCGLDGRCEPGGVPVLSSVDKGLRALRQFGAPAFPWDEGGIKRALEAKERRVSDLKGKLAGFEFLRPQSADEGGRGPLVRGTGSNRKVVSVDDVFASNGSDDSDGAVLGLYFSAHWCPPCRAFTPELLREYEDIRAQSGANIFEVVFISFDSDENEFEKYYSSMTTPSAKEQWLCLEYSMFRDLAKDLSEVFQVRGFPSLVLLKRDGTILCDDARGSVSKYGASCFPWDPDSIRKGNEKLLKEEEDELESQRATGDGVVVKRIAGPIGSVKYDTAGRVVEFGNSFSTALLDETVASRGVQYYEAEMLAMDPRRHLAQFGFALRGAFERVDDTTGDGVGDNGKSWGVCGFRKELWHDGECAPMNNPSSTCGWEVGDVIGFAANVEEGKIAISKNGNWSEDAGCGVVFEELSLIDAVSGAGVIFPGLSGRGLKVRLNVHEKDLRFSKPSDDVWQSGSNVPAEN